jgi:hypothetical protein
MKDIRIPIALLIIGIGLLLGPATPVIPDWINPLNWIVHGPATVAIIEETAVRSQLPALQIALMDSITFPQEIQKSGGSYLGCFDKDIVDRDKKPPQDLVPYLEAAKAIKLPALVYKHGSKITAIALPPDEKTALEKLK